MNFLSVVVTAPILAGTWIQARDSLRGLRAVDPEAQRAFSAVDDLKIEYPASRHPIRWWRRQQQVDELLRSSPREALLYRRVWRQVVSWWLLTMGAGLSAILVFFEWI